jgi:hypothetical protein
MTLLRDAGPKTTSELWGMLQERFPGVIQFKRNMKRDVLTTALKNKASALLHPSHRSSPYYSHPLSPPPVCGAGDKDPVPGDIQI